MTIHTHKSGCTHIITLSFKKISGKSLEIVDAVVEMLKQDAVADSCHFLITHSP